MRDRYFGLIVNAHSSISTTLSSPSSDGLLTGKELLKHIWPNAESRPSLRWLRSQQAKRTLPYVKFGRLVFFDPVKVRRALDKRFSVDIS